MMYNACIYKVLTLRLYNDNNTIIKIHMKEITLYKPNELISIISELELNRTARHLLNYFLRHAQKKIKFDNYKEREFEINIQEVNELAKINQKNYKLISKALDCLVQSVTLMDNPKRIIKLVPVTYVDLDLDKGVYKFKLEDIVIDLLKNTDYFTKLDLKEFNPLKSKHSIVIFEYLKRYENLGQIPLVTMEELRAITDTKDKYPNFTDFEKKVLGVAKNEINEHTAYTVDYLTIKKRTCRRLKVGAIQFYFSKKKNQEENKSIDKNIQEEESKTLYKQVFLDKNSLYYEFIKFAPNLEKHVYIRSTYTYRESTLKAFLFSIQKNQNYLNSQTYMQWLEDRTNNKNIYKNYLRMAMPFNAKEVILKFKEASELVLKREFTQDEINQINNFLSYFDFYEYSVLVKKFETLFNQLVPTNSYNPFTKMIERNA